MAINQAIIRIRRGLKDELQIDKLLPGELAMATDAPCLWFCWAPGSIEQVPTSGNVIDSINEIVQEYIENNDISVIGKVYMRIFNGWVQYSPDGKTWENIITLADIRGDEGGYYIPVVNNDGTISWQPSQDGMEELQDSLILSKDIIEAVLGYVPLKKADVVDNLLSDADNLPLSARMGKELNTNITTPITPIAVDGIKFNQLSQFEIGNIVILNFDIVIEKDFPAWTNGQIAFCSARNYAVNNLISQGGNVMQVSTNNGYVFFNALNGLTAGNGFNGQLISSK